jgi:acetyl-CoA synthetase
MARMIGATSADYREVYQKFQWTIPPYYNIGVEVCDQHAAKTPGAVAVFFEDEDGNTCQYSFDEIKALSNRLANALVYRGCCRGDRIAILLPQVPENGIAHVAIYKAGAIAVPLSSLFGPDAIEYRLKDSGARALITDAVGSSKLRGMRDRLEFLEHIYVIDGDAETGELDLARELEQGSPYFVPVRTRADDPALIIYTSGTTGSPKGVLHAHRALLGQLPGFELSHCFFPQRGDMFWSPADWAWAGGLLDSLLPTWNYGSPILGFKFSKKFDPDRVFRLIEKYHIRNTFLPPTALRMMRQVAKRGKCDKLKLRTVMSAGESLGAETMEWASEHLGTSVNEMFGQTEANYVIGNCHALMPIKPGSMGKAYPGSSVAVLDQHGQVLPWGETGEIAVRRDTPGMFLEYWNNPEATHAKFRNEWMLTGDLASSDTDGYLFFKGRSDDIINSAGYRVGPTEIEECLLKHPAVSLAAVIGIPHQIRGNVIKAFVQLSSGYTGSEALKNEIQAHVKQRLAAYEYPRLIDFVEEIPTTTTGKIKRDELRRREMRLT